MDIKEIRAQSAERLLQTAAELRASIRHLRFTVGTRQRKDVRQLRAVKRELARVLTVAQQKTS